LIVGILMAEQLGSATQVVGNHRLCAEDCLMSIWFVKPLWDQSICCCASPWMQSVGGQQERGEVV